jgi:cytochrome c2
MAVSVIPIDDTAFRPTGPWKTIFLSDPEPNDPSDESGGRLAIGAHHKLYLTIGCYFGDARKVSQDPASSFGKILEIDPDTGSHRVVSLGHRNPQGLTVTSSGALFSTEHGPKGGDELNLITEGSNYGWPNVSLGTGYKDFDLENHANVGERTSYQSPVFAWVPSIGPSNLIEVRGFDRRWDGDLLVASLKANSLFRLRLEGTRVLYAEPIWVGQRIRDMLQLKSGTIVLWTDDTQLLFVSVDREQLAGSLRLSMKVNKSLHYACMYCHHFGPTTPVDLAPTLSNIFSRKIGSDNFHYSEALRSKEGRWTEKSLKEFLSNPAGFANGTNMPPLDINTETINEIVGVLQEIEHTANARVPSEALSYAPSDARQ